MTAKNRNRLIMLGIVMIPVLIFIGFLISEIIQPTPTSLSAPAAATTNQDPSPR